MTFYEAYKPLRNVIWRAGLVPGLLAVWYYGLHLLHHRSLPPGIPQGTPFAARGRLSQHVHPWDLDILSRELLLHASGLGSLRLERWADLAKVINHVRRLDDLASSQPDAPDVMHELHRIAHRQFPWQRPATVDSTIRYLKVFGADALSDIVERELGMTTVQFLQLGHAVCGHFLRESALSVRQDYSVLGLKPDQSKAFFDRIVATPEQLRAELSAAVTYDADWLYAWNPLELRPLVRYDPRQPDLVLCPIPTYQLRRVSSGIFHDIVQSKGFNNPFGDAFETYVGEVMTLTCPTSRFRMLRDRPFFIGRQEHRNVDWVLSDGTSELAIECKAKRLKLDAKIRANTAALSTDLEQMARAIVQHYRNICNALEGRAPWKPDDTPIYPVILTFEDWFMFGPSASDMLANHVTTRMQQVGLSMNMVTDMPYTVMSVAEFELTTQVIAQTGIQAVFNKKLEPETRMWTMIPFLQKNFPAQVQRCHHKLFMDEMESLLKIASSAAGNP